MSYTTTRIFIQGANGIEKLTIRGMWTYIIITIFICIGIIRSIQIHQAEYGKLVSSAEYRHAMVPKYIRDVPSPEHNNGPIPIVNYKLSTPVSDSREAPKPSPSHIKISATPKMEEIIAIKNVDVVMTRDQIKEMLNKHNYGIKALRRKDLEKDSL